MTTTKFTERGTPVEWATTESEAKHWRQFTVEDLRKMVAKRYAVTPLELSSMTREALIFAIEQWAAKSAGKREARVDRRSIERPDRERLTAHDRKEAAGIISTFFKDKLANYEAPHNATVYAEWAMTSLLQRFDMRRRD